MQRYPVRLVSVVFMLAACNADVGDLGEPSTDGTLIVSTATQGDDPDPDGYLLTVDGVDSVALDPTGTAEIVVASGPHTLRLLGVADHCTASPDTPFEVDIPASSRIPVAFVFNCPATGARITATTTGLDIDPDGYRIAVDGTDRGTIPANETLLLRLDPGSRTIALTGLTPNCTISGSGSQATTIVVAEVASIEFAVVCTATTGVVGVAISGTGVGAVFEATVDGVTPFPVGRIERAYLEDVSAGDHVVSLNAPAGCSVKTDPLTVSVTVGTLVRDTVRVTFP